MRIKADGSQESAEYRLAILLEEMQRRVREDKLARYKPYARQKEFHTAGATKNERLFMAGNQLGKTMAGAMETTFHLTGLYPDWWQGLRFDKPTRIWAASTTGELTRDNCQRYLLGEIEEGWGTGAIPRRLIKKIRRSTQVPDGVNYVLVKHVSGGISRLQFKTFDQGALKWQGATIDFVWNDEEPPIDVYSEGLTRTNRGQRSHAVMTTFTPLLGMSDTVNRFLSKDEGVRTPNGHVTRMGINDVEHYSEEEKKSIIAAYPAHEREARANGTPILGSGRIFRKAYSDIEVEPFAIPSHWPQIAGIDIGGAGAGSHPAAAVKLVFDPDTDTIYVVTVWREREVTLADHASAVKRFGENIPVAWPHDALQHDRKSGQKYKEEFENEGLNMCDHHARFPDFVSEGLVKQGSVSVEAGVLEMNQRFAQGRLKVFSGNDAFRDEYEMYHRKDGLIVKLNDDVLSATRYGVVMIRYAEVPEATGWGDFKGNINANLNDDWAR